MWIALALSVLGGFGLGWLVRGWFEERRAMTSEEWAQHKVYRRRRLQDWVQRYGLVLVLIVVVAQTLTLFLVYRQSKDLAATNERQHMSDVARQRSLVCQVHHNELTARVLTANSGAARQTIESELHLWVRFRNGIESQRLTGPASVATIDKHIADLRHRLRTIAANPYPPGGLCEQLLRGVKPRER